MNAVTALLNEVHLKPKAKDILAYLRKRSTITPLVALTTFGTMRLAAHIFDLRKAGFEIETRMKEDEAGNEYASYTLISDKAA